MKNCKIIQDFLPNYIENLTCEETNKYIENHIDNCEECKKVLENMKNELSENKENENKELDYLKNIKRKIFILISIIAIFIIIVLAIFLQKWIIINNLSEKSEELTSISNYYAKVCSYENENLHIVETFHQDEIELTRFNVISKDLSLDIKMYQDKDKPETIILHENGKTGEVFNTIENTGFFNVSIDNEIMPFSEISIKEKLKYLCEIRNITRVVCNNKECYLIDFYMGHQIYIERDTGLKIREVSSSTDSRVYDYTYQFNEVVEIEYPNLNEYDISYR